MKYDLVVRGDFVTSTCIFADIQVGIRKGLIVGIHAGHERLTTEEFYDARGKLVFPGIIDSHVHCYSYPGEGVANATRAAVAGGVTTIVEMPFDAGETVTTEEILNRKITTVNEQSFADVALLGTVNKSGDLSNLPAMFDNGICGLKFSLTESDPKRFPRINDGILYDALPLLAKYRLPVGFHAENNEIVNYLTNRAKTEAKYGIMEHSTTRPPISEYLEIAKLLEFARYSGVCLHLNHLTLAHSMDMAIRYKQEGVNVSLETCPHYLLLSDDDMKRIGMLAKINPPLRNHQELDAIWQHVLGGRIDILASDHAPWPLSKKASDNVFDNAAGSPSIETFFPLMFFEIVGKRGASPTLIVRHMSENPAKRFGLAHRKRGIVIGADADMVILDPHRTWTIHASEMQMAAGWSLFDGWNVKGHVSGTILRGKIVYDGRDILGVPGDGQFIPASIS